MASAITDMEIEALARGIGINQKLDGLGLKLGYIPSEMNIYKANNYSGASVTHQGTKQMLNDWRDKTAKEQQRPILKKALEDAELVRLAEIHLGGEAATGTGQTGRSETETLSEQPRTQTKNGGTNTINAPGAGNVSGNNMIGQQTNVYNSAPSAPAVHHHHITTNVNRAPPARLVYNPRPAAPKRQANTIIGPAPKRAKVTASIPSASKGTTSKPKKSATTTTKRKPKAKPAKSLPHATKKTAAPKVTASVPSTSKGTTSKPKKSATSTTQRKPKAKSPGNLPHANKKPAAPTASKKKAPTTKNDTKTPKKKAPKKAKKPVVKQKKPPKAKQPKAQKSKTSRQARPKKKSKK